MKTAVILCVAVLIVASEIVNAKEHEKHANKHHANKLHATKHHATKHHATKHHSLKHAHSRHHASRTHSVKQTRQNTQFEPKTLYSDGVECQCQCPVQTTTPIPTTTTTQIPTTTTTQIITDAPTNAPTEAIPTTIINLTDAPIDATTTTTVPSVVTTQKSENQVIKIGANISIFFGTEFVIYYNSKTDVALLFDIGKQVVLLFGPLTDGKRGVISYNIKTKAIIVFKINTNLKTTYVTELLNELVAKTETNIDSGETIQVDLLIAVFKQGTSSLKSELKNIIDVYFGALIVQQSNVDSIGSVFVFILFGSSNSEFETQVSETVKLTIDVGFSVAFFSGFSGALQTGNTDTVSKYYGALVAVKYGNGITLDVAISQALSGSSNIKCGKSTDATFVFINLNGSFLLVINYKYVLYVESGAGIILYNKDFKLALVATGQNIFLVNTKTGAVLAIRLLSATFFEPNAELAAKLSGDVNLAAAFNFTLKYTSTLKTSLLSKNNFLLTGLGLINTALKDQLKLNFNIILGVSFATGLVFYTLLKAIFNVSSALLLSIGASFYLVINAGLVSAAIYQQLITAVISFMANTKTTLFGAFTGKLTLALGGSASGTGSSNGTGSGSLTGSGSGSSTGSGSGSVSGGGSGSFSGSGSVSTGGSGSLSAGGSVSGGFSGGASISG